MQELYPKQISQANINQAILDGKACVVTKMADIRKCVQKGIPYHTDVIRYKQENAFEAVLLVFSLQTTSAEFAMEGLEVHLMKDRLKELCND